MTIIDFLQAALLGGVEALTEFLPVSSTGHLILLGRILGFEGPPGRVFEVAIQLGAILAVVVLYFRRLWHVFTTLGTDPASRHFAIVSIIAFIPAVIAGFIFHDVIKDVLYSPLVVCLALIAGGVAILLIERLRHVPTIMSIDTMPYKTALLIGLAQCLALIPGVSRSGATIMGALMCSVDRRTAAEFSFFQAIPLMVGAVGYDLWKNRDTASWDGAALIAVGFITAFIVALFIVRWILNFVTRYGFAPFAYYRIVIGIIGLSILFFIP